MHICDKNKTYISKILEFNQKWRSFKNLIKNKKRHRAIPVNDYCEDDDDF